MTLDLEPEFTRTKLGATRQAKGWILFSCTLNGDKKLVRDSTNNQVDQICKLDFLKKVWKSFTYQDYV